MAEREWPEEAREHFERGYEAQMAGRLEEAIDRYSRSLAIHPTAEAHTFLGWALSYQGKHEEAIEECKRAIAVDPAFGNPYNDIGAYLIAKGDLDEAVPWLEQAKQAPRYEPRHFPYMNLGRLYAAKGMIQQAIREFERALELQPGEPTCEGFLARLRALLN